MSWTKKVRDQLIEDVKYARKIRSHWAHRCTPLTWMWREALKECIKECNKALDCGDQRKVSLLQLQIGWLIAGIFQSLKPLFRP